MIAKHRKTVYFVTLTALCALTIMAAPESASADDTIVVLGLSSVEGDDALASDLTRAIRHRVASVDGWIPSNREVSLEQMVAAFGCEGPVPECLGEIAGDLGAQGLILGEIRRTDGGFALELGFFDESAGNVIRTVSDTIPQVRTDVGALRPRVAGYVAELSGNADYGSIAILGDTPGAEVFLDGEAVGHADSQGALLVREVLVGSHDIRVESDGHDFSTQVTVTEGESATVGVALQPSMGNRERFGADGESSDRHGNGEQPLLWPSYALWGAGAFFTGMTAFSWARLGNLDNDADFLTYRMAVPTGLDACGEARNGNNHGAALAILNGARDVCGQGHRLERWQWVFLTAAVAAIAVGTWWFIKERRRANRNDDDDDEEEDEDTYEDEYEDEELTLEAEEATEEVEVIEEAEVVPVAAAPTAEPEPAIEAAPEPESAPVQEEAQEDAEPEPEEDDDSESDFDDDEFGFLLDLNRPDPHAAAYA